jgi:hypothetical protein
LFQGSSPSHNHIRCSASSLSAVITSRFVFTSLTYRGCANFPRYLLQYLRPDNDRSPHPRPPERKAEAHLQLLLQKRKASKKCLAMASLTTFVGTQATTGVHCQVKQTHHSYALVHTDARQSVMYVVPWLHPFARPLFANAPLTPCSTALQPSFDTRRQRMARWLHSARLLCRWR